MILTLDHNCVISIEENREPHATGLRELASLASQYHLAFAVYSYLPLENRPKDGPVREFADFPKRLEALGIGPIATLNGSIEPMLLWWLQCVLFPTMPYHFETYLAAECKAADIDWEKVREANPRQYPPPFPKSPHDIVPPPPDTLDAETKEKYRVFWDERHRKWNNKKSDVLAIGAHIAHVPYGVFFTTDERLLRCRGRIREHVPNFRILTPSDTLAEMKSLATLASSTE